VRILYGGSVKPSNSRAILALSEVGGALVGGASLKSEEFAAIFASAPAQSGTIAAEKTQGWLFASGVLETVPVTGRRRRSAPGSSDLGAQNIEDDYVNVFCMGERVVGDGHYATHQKRHWPQAFSRPWRQSTAQRST
jgi:hypothetical protein